MSIKANMKSLGCILTDLKNLHGDLHALVMLWRADGRGGCRWPSHALLHVRLQNCILLLLLPLTPLLLLQLVSHQLWKHTQKCSLEKEDDVEFGFFSLSCSGDEELAVP